MRLERTLNLFFLFFIFILLVELCSLFGAFLGCSEAMNDLEERVAVRYGEAKEYVEQFRSMQKALSPKDQVLALDAAQSAREIDGFFSSFLFDFGVVG